MSVVSLLGVKVLNNPALFTAPYEFEITFECLEQLREGRTLHHSYIGHQLTISVSRPRMETHIRRLCNVC